MTIFDEYPAFGSFEAVEHDILWAGDLVFYFSIVFIL